VAAIVRRPYLDLNRKFGGNKPDSINETRHKIRRRFDHSTGFENGAGAGESSAASAVNRLRKLGPKSGIALLVAGKNRVERGRNPS
jgi:hypothetical protein